MPRPTSSPAAGTAGSRKKRGGAAFREPADHSARRQDFSVAQDGRIPVWIDYRWRGRRSAQRAAMSGRWLSAGNGTRKYCSGYPGLVEFDGDHALHRNFRVLISRNTCRTSAAGSWWATICPRCNSRPRSNTRKRLDHVVRRGNSSYGLFESLPGIDDRTVLRWVRGEAEG